MRMLLSGLFNMLMLLLLLKTVLCAYQDEVDKKLAALFEELAIWEGYLSKVYLFVDVS